MYHMQPTAAILLAHTIQREQLSVLERNRILRKHERGGRR